MLFLILHYILLRFMNNKIIKKITINDETGNTVCTKENVIYFSLHKNNNIGKYYNNEYTKIKICDDMYTCLYMIMGLRGEIYMLIMREIIDIEFESYYSLKFKQKRTKKIIEFGVYEDYYHKICDALNSCNLPRKKNREIIIGSSDFYLIYKPEYVF